MKVLLVEDNKSIRESLAKFLISIGHNVFQVSNGSDALKIIRTTEIHLVLSDIRMPKMDGHELLAKIKNEYKNLDLEVILYTGHGDIKSAVNAIKNGAYDYLLKPIDINELDVTIKRLSDYLILKKKARLLTDHFNEEVQQATKFVNDDLINARRALAIEVGTASIGIFSPALKKVFSSADKLHKNPDLPVLIEGETGTGKELIARYIHFGSGEVVTPFVGLNCAAISGELFESELFGYESGTFTGGHTKGKKGKLELANNGTIFLDEITEMPITHQTKLLRVLQEREYYRVGGLERMEAKARFVFATNRNVSDFVEKGNFRQDLYYRLNVGHIRIPPLRERKEEIIPLAEMFLAELRERKGTHFMNIERQASELLMEYNWPGNIRELKNTIERIVLFFNGEEIKSIHLENLLSKRQTSGASSNHQTIINSSLDDTEEFNLDSHIHDLVKNSYLKNNRNKTHTAQKLGISYRVLQTYLKHIEDIK